MHDKYPEYCAAIRTLGKSGGKYLTTLQSLCNQTVKPKKILVYIAEGYDLPKETVGTEQYVYCRKGMVAQRSVDYEEAGTDYLLLLDDDIYLPENGVENMFNGLKSNGGGMYHIGYISLTRSHGTPETALCDRRMDTAIEKDKMGIPNTQVLVLHLPHIAKAKRLSHTKRGRRRAAMPEIGAAFHTFGGRVLD